MKRIFGAKVYLGVLFSLFLIFNVLFAEENSYMSEKNPVVTITMENGEKIVMQLFPEIAPNTVNSFIHLIESKFYDGLIFHRIVPDFVVQGGCPDGTGTGDPGYLIKGEFTTEIGHHRGTLAMARANDPNSGGSQFYICLNDATAKHLDGKYAIFGEVVDGMDVVDGIQIGDAMMKVEVDTKGVDYPLPERITKY